MNPGAPAGTAGLSVERLVLTDFRNYSRLRLDLDPRPVVLTGANGAGKTNLLEAVSFLAPGRGLRGARLSEVGRRLGGLTGEDRGRPWAVAARLGGPHGTIEVGTGGEATGTDGASERRTVRIDGEPAAGQAKLSEVATVLWLTPQMDRIFLDGPSGRRRFLDRLVFGFDPAHAGRVSAYEHALRERARLLRQGGADARWLAALEETMAAKGVAVAAARRETVARLNGVSAEGSGLFPGAISEAAGDVEGWLGDGPALAAEDRLRDALAASRRHDAEAGGAAVGPHRSDFRVSHSAKGIPAGQCSTGEQKAVLIALVLANTRLLAVERGTVPLLLLDEVLAHLDSRRRDALFGEILGSGIQAWFTGTEVQPFASLGGAAQHFCIEDGRATRG